MPKKKLSKFHKLTRFVFGLLFGIPFLLARLTGYSVTMIVVAFVVPMAWILYLCKIVPVKPHNFLELGKELWEDDIGKYL